MRRVMGGDYHDRAWRLSVGAAVGKKENAGSCL